MYVLAIFLQLLDSEIKDGKINIIKTVKNRSRIHFEGLNSIFCKMYRLQLKTFDYAVFWLLRKQ